MSVSCLLAIDPGLTGAVAIYFPDAPERVSIHDMPVAGGEVDPAALARRIRQFGPQIAVVERVGPMPRDGVRQAFGFGAAYAAARTVITILEVPMHLVTPQIWKKHWRLPGGAQGKEAARALALRLFPASAEHFARKRDHNRAEAALIARFGAERLLSGGGAR
jgi:hypothetical protein